MEKSTIVRYEGNDMTEEKEILAKQNFHEDMLKLFKRTAKEVKYKPTRRLDLINKYGGYEAAIKMLPTDSNTFDFTLLWENERLDLSIEALITKERYQNLFPKEVVDFCQKRLDEYNYAPKKLMPEPDDMDDFLNQLLTTDVTPKAVMPELAVGEGIVDTLLEPIYTEKWYELFMSDTIFTQSNRDLVLKIYALGERYITAGELGDLEGYSASYPFYDVILALCKRIKSALKLETPLDDAGKPQWWLFIFKGEVEDKKQFTWSLRDELRAAIAQLIQEEVLPSIEVAVVEKLDSPSSLIEPTAEVPVEEVPKEVPKEMPSLEDSIVETTPKIATPEVIKNKVPEAVVQQRSEPSIATKAPEEDTFSESLDQVPPSSTISPLTSYDPLAALEDAIFTDEPDEVALPEVTPDAEAIPYEQNPLWHTLTEQCIDYYGPICELCGFDFGYTYGPALDGFIHIHCITPDKLEALESINPQEDLIPVCCNCEAVMRHRIPPYTAQEVRNMLEGNK